MRACVLVLLAGCASSSMGTGDDARRTDAASSVDAGVIDAPAPIDAAPDAAPVRPGREVVSAGGRVRSGAITMDVELGHPIEQSRATAGSVELRGAAVVNP